MESKTKKQKKLYEIILLSYLVFGAFVWCVALTTQYTMAYIGGILCIMTIQTLLILLTILENRESNEEIKGLISYYIIKGVEKRNK